MNMAIDWLSLGPALTVLMVLMLLDVIGGFLVAGIKNEISSSVSYKGMLKKVGIFVYVGVGMCLDLLMVNYQEYVGLHETFRPPLTVAAFVTLFYCAHESISVLEKLDRSGIPMPSFLRSILKRLKKTTTEAGSGSFLTVKIDSDHQPHPSEKLAARVEARREARREDQLNRMEQQAAENHVLLEQNHVLQVENSAVLKQQRTAHGEAEDTVTEKPAEHDHGPQVSSDVSH